MINERINSLFREELCPLPEKVFRKILHFSIYTFFNLLNNFFTFDVECMHYSVTNQKFTNAIVEDDPHWTKH